MIETGNYLEVSNIVLDKIEGPNYNQNKQVQNEFLRNNASVAKRKDINIFYRLLIIYLNYNNGFYF